MALTSLRLFAALMVVFLHLRGLKVITDGPAWFLKIASVGHVGVSFFFVLSGFVLVYTYAGHDLNRRVFWRARFARIYPAYAFALVFSAPFFLLALNTFPFFAWASQHFTLACLLVIGLLQAWVPLAALSWSMVLWSLSVEAFFYLVFPLALEPLSRRSPRVLLLIAAGCWAISLLVCSLYVWLKPDGDIAIANDYGTWLNVVKFNPLVRLPEFLVGMTTGFLFLKKRHEKQAALPAVALGLAAIAFAITFQQSIPFVILHTALVGPAFAAVLFGFALEPRWSRMLNAPILVLLGDASYSLYLLHVPILIYFFYGTGRRRFANPAGILAFFAIAFIASVLVYRFIEEPMRRRMNPGRASKLALREVRETVPAA